MNGHQHLEDSFWRVAAEIPQAVEHDSLSDAIFSRLAIDRHLTYRFLSSWATEVTDISVAEGRLLSATENSHQDVVAAILDLEGVLIRLALKHGQLLVAAAGSTQECFEKIVERLKAEFPEPEIAPDEPKVSFRFSWDSPNGLRLQLRTLDVVRWRDVEQNYGSPTRGQLTDLAGNFAVGRSGQTVIWHGAPGTGKTNALRALSFEWRDWCDFTIVTDPDALFGSSASYMMEVLTVWETGERWHCIVLEDAGELLCGDARRYVGQGLSRFLNLCDGLLGQLQNVILLVTTNEPLRRIHPAVRRPGRCAAEVEFRPFSVNDANAWLAERCDVRVTAPTTLAELYALASDSVPLQAVDSWPGIGFGSAL